MTVGFCVALKEQVYAESRHILMKDVVLIYCVHIDVVVIMVEV